MGFCAWFSTAVRFWPESKYTNLWRTYPALLQPTISQKYTVFDSRVSLAETERWLLNINLLRQREDLGGLLFEPRIRHTWNRDVAHISIRLWPFRAIPDSTRHLRFLTGASPTISSNLVLDKNGWKKKKNSSNSIKRRRVINSSLSLSLSHEDLFLFLIKIGIIRGFKDMSKVHPTRGGFSPDVGFHSPHIRFLSGASPTASSNLLLH